MLRIRRRRGIDPIRHVSLAAKSRTLAITLLASMAMSIGLVTAGAPPANASTTCGDNTTFRTTSDFLWFASSEPVPKDNGRSCKINLVYKNVDVGNMTYTIYHSSGRKDLEVCDTKVDGVTPILRIFTTSGGSVDYPDNDNDPSHCKFYTIYYPITQFQGIWGDWYTAPLTLT